MLTRRQFIQRGATGAAVLMVGGTLAQRPTFGATPLAKKLTPYLDQMPLLVDNAIDATADAGASYDVRAALVTRKVHQQLPAAQFFGYLPGLSGDPGGSYLGPAFVAKTGVPFSVNYHNKLEAKDYLKVFTNNGSSYEQFPPFKEARILSHLHGGFVAWADDEIGRAHV